MLTTKENDIFLMVKNVVEKGVPKKYAVENLGITIQHLNRLIKKYKEEGIEGFAHKGRGKTSHKKTSQKILDEICNLYITEYFDYNFEHFYEEINNKYKVSYAIVYNELTSRDIISPMAQKSTKKAYYKDMKKAIDNNEVPKEIVNIYETRLLIEEQAHIRKSTNLYKFGEEVQMDAAFLVWFGAKASALHLAVDKATKIVLFGWFEWEETTRTYFILLINIILNYGIPKLIRTDKRGSFSANNNKKSKFNTTQFGMVCDELNIELETSSNPLFKPNVERENNTFENRLKAELRHEGITDIDKANEYLNDIFIPKMNKRFAYKIDTNKTLMRENKYSFEELNVIISEKYQRKIDNASSISYKRKYYQPINSNNEIISYKAKTECLVVIAYDYSLWSKIENNYYKLKEVEHYKSDEKKEDVNNTNFKEIKKYIPPKDHPWRKFKI